MNGDGLNLPKFAVIVAAGTVLGLGASAVWAESINVTFDRGNGVGKYAEPGSSAIGHDHVWVPIAFATNHGKGAIEIASVTTKAHVRLIGFGLQPWSKGGGLKWPLKSWPVGGSAGPVQKVIRPHSFGQVWVGSSFRRMRQR